MGAPVPVTPRRLRVLLIDDRPVTRLETDGLELMTVPQGDEYDPSLGTWAQHLRLWSEQRFPQPEPDLILIDCRFEDDQQYAPTSVRLAQQDPRGLLHGALYAARLFGRDRYHPFGFAIYSMDASGFAEDPYAQTFMGFLLAMRDSTLAEGDPGAVRGRRDRELVGVCSRELASTVRQNPATAWSWALQMYRQRLREVADLQGVVFDRESWLQARDAVEHRRLGASLRWRRRDGQLDEVLLESLFADRLMDSGWNEEAWRAAAEWLDGLLVLGDHLGQARQWVYQLLEQQSDPEQLPVPRGQDLHGNRLTSFFHACAGVVAWYENRSSGEPRLASSNLVLQLGLSDKQLNRYFKPLIELPWGRVVDLLDEGLEQGYWPLPGQWELLRVAREWCQEVRGVEFPLRGAGE